jgi:hypothetical protein
MEPTVELIEALHREEVAAARRLTAEQKLSLGGDLFDQVCERMRAGIRAEFPETDERQVERILRLRLAIARRLEQAP